MNNKGEGARVMVPSTGIVERMVEFLMMNENVDAIDPDSLCKKKFDVTKSDVNYEKVSLMLAVKHIAFSAGIGLKDLLFCRKTVGKWSFFIAFLVVWVAMIAKYYLL
mgnify:CR=1 FL=1